MPLLRPLRLSVFRSLCGPEKPQQTIGLRSVHRQSSFLMRGGNFVRPSQNYSIPRLEQEVRSVASTVSGVIGLEKCHVRKVGFRYYVDLHIVVEGTLTVRQGHNIAHDVEDAVLEQVPQIAEVLVHVEPEEELLTPSLKR